MRAKISFAVVAVLLLATTSVRADIIPFAPDADTTDSVAVFTFTINGNASAAGSGSNSGSAPYALHGVDPVANNGGVVVQRIFDGNRTRLEGSDGVLGIDELGWSTWARVGAQWTWSFTEDALAYLADYDLLGYTVTIDSNTGNHGVYGTTVTEDGGSFTGNWDMRRYGGSYRAGDGKNYSPWNNGAPFSFTVTYYGTAVPNAVPEPATLAVLGLGLAGLGIARRRMKK